MEKKKGSALVMAVVITAVLIILSLSVLSLSTSSFKNNIAYDRINQVRLMAESGIEQAIGQLKNGSNTTVADIKSADNFFTTKVVITPNTPQPNYYTIVSTATGGRYSKIITVVYKKSTSTSGGGGTPGTGTPAEVADLANNYVLRNALSISSVGSQSVFRWPDATGNSANNAVNISGDFYVSGNFVNFTPTEFAITGDVIYSGDDRVVEQTKNNASHFGVHVGDTLETNNKPAAITPSTNYDTVPRLYPENSGNLIVFNVKAPTGGTVYLADIDRAINTAYGSKPGFSNMFKVITVTGDLNILYGNYSNYIIYCTGNIFLDGNNSNNDRNAVNLNNSTMCANNGIKFDYKVNLNINYNSSIVSGAADMIKSYLNDSLSTEGDEGITDWKE